MFEEMEKLISPGSTIDFTVPDITLSGLIDELESLAERFWRADDCKTADAIGASELCHLVGRFGEAVNRARGYAEVRYNAALEAYWADKARDFAKTSPEGEHAVRAIDENMAISRAAVELEAKRGEFLRLLDLLALEFIDIALRCNKPRLYGFQIVFECLDVLAIKKRAEALKRLARTVDELEYSDDFFTSVHAAIIAYSNELRLDGVCNQTPLGKAISELIERRNKRHESM